MALKGISGGLDWPVLTLYNGPAGQLICPKPKFLAPGWFTHMSQSSLQIFLKNEICRPRGGPFLVRHCVKYVVLNYSTFVILDEFMFLI